MGNRFGNVTMNEGHFRQIESGIRSKFHRDTNPDFGTEAWKHSVVQLIQEYINLYRFTYVEFNLEKYRFVIRCCTNNNINDSELTIQALEVFFRLQEERPMVFHCLPNRDKLETVLKHANVRSFDFWGVRRGTGVLAEEFNPVVECFNTSSLFSGNCSAAEVFLRYGFRYSFQDSVYEARCMDFLSRKYRLYNHPSANGINHLMDREGQFRKFRMLLIIDTFSVFALPLTHERVRTLSCIFRSIPDPYVTVEEIMREITPMVSPEFYAPVTHVINQYTAVRGTQNQYFDQLDCTLLTPRPLLHLCRIRIRDALAANLALPKGIEDIKLPGMDRLPTQIRRYLNLEK